MLNLDVSVPLKDAITSHVMSTMFLPVLMKLITIKISLKFFSCFFVLISDNVTETRGVGEKVT